MAFNNLDVMPNADNAILYLKSEIVRLMRETDEAERKKQLINLISSNEQIENYITKILGVYGGGFAIVHEATDRVILLQKSVYQLEEENDELIKSLARVDIPYNYTDLSGAIKKSCLIDLLFIMRRASQPMHDLTNDDFFPEFFQSLPPSKGVNKIDETFWLNHEVKLRKHEGFEFLHCTTGEIYFFIIIWRFLLGEIKIHGVEGILDEIFQKSKNQDKDAYELLSKIDDSIEGEFLSLVNEIKKNNSDNEEYSKFIKYALHEWYIVHQRYDKCLDKKNFIEDWENIGILQQGMVTDILSDVIEFIINFLRNLMATLTNDQNSSEKISNLCNEFNDLSEKVRNELDHKTLSENKNVDIKETYALFQKAFYVFLEHISEKRKPHQLQLAQLINCLHVVSRFPILPYFYLSVLDTDKAPKEHLVFPSSKSYKYSAGKFKSGHVHSVVTCLLTIRRIPFNDKDNYLNKLNVIYFYFKEMSDVINDLSFYGGVVKRKQKQENDDQILTTLDHEFKSILYLLREINRDITPSNCQFLAKMANIAHDYIGIITGSGQLGEEYTLGKNNLIYFKTWVEKCLNTAWKINLITNYTYASKRLDNINFMRSQIECEYETNNVLKSIAVIPQEYYYNQNLDKDNSVNKLGIMLTRWMIAALTNTIKWSNKKYADDLNSIDKWIAEDISNPDSFYAVKISLNVRGDNTFITIKNLTNQLNKSNKSNKEVSTKSSLARIANQINSDEFGAFDKIIHLRAITEHRYADKSERDDMKSEFADILSDEEIFITSLEISGASIFFRDHEFATLK